MKYLYNSILLKLRNSSEYAAPFFKLYQTEILIGTCVFFLAFTIAKIIKKFRSNFPPGPVGLPIVGYSPFLSEDVHLDFAALGKKYGDVFSIRLWSQNIVVLNGAEAIKEALNKTEFLGRPPFNAIELANPLSPFFGSDYHSWKEQRPFVVHSMKDLGLGKTKIEEDVKDEINHFLEMLKNYKGKPLDLKDSLTQSLSNNIFALVFGKRYDYDDPDRQLLDKSLEDANESFSQISAEVLSPWIRYIPFLTKKVDKTKISFSNYRTYFKKEINEHIPSLDAGNIRDFIDRYLLEINFQMKKDPNTTFHSEMLKTTATDLVMAGSETVLTSILWIIYTMAAFSDVQKKVHNEIMEVIGSERKPEFSDMKNMPYTSAVMLELMRWKAINPLNLMRYTLADTTVGGYDIPKGTLVLANFWNVHNDPQHWNEPEKFKPERFLSKDGKSPVKSSNYMPFSLGKRACPGKSMAYLEIFLYFTSILQKFEVMFPVGVKPTFDAQLKITYRLDPFLVKLVPKN